MGCRQGIAKGHEMYVALFQVAEARQWREALLWRWLYSKKREANIAHFAVR